MSCSTYVLPLHSISLSSTSNFDRLAFPIALCKIENRNKNIWHELAQMRRHFAPWSMCFRKTWWGCSNFIASLCAVIFVITKTSFTSCRPTNLWMKTQRTQLIAFRRRIQMMHSYYTRKRTLTEKFSLDNLHFDVNHRFSFCIFTQQFPVIWTRLHTIPKFSATRNNFQFFMRIFCFFFFLCFPFESSFKFCCFSVVSVDVVAVVSCDFALYFYEKKRIFLTVVNCCSNVFELHSLLIVVEKGKKNIFSFFFLCVINFKCILLQLKRERKWCGFYLLTERQVVSALLPIFSLRTSHTNEHFDGSGRAICKTCAESIDQRAKEKEIEFDEIKIEWKIK